MIFQWRMALASHFPGVLVCMVIALAATFISEHYGGPQSVSYTHLTLPTNREV